MTDKARVYFGSLLGAVANTDTQKNPAAETTEIIETTEIEAAVQQNQDTSP